MKSLLLKILMLNFFLIQSGYSQNSIGFTEALIQNKIDTAFMYIAPGKRKIITYDILKKTHDYIHLNLGKMQSPGGVYIGLQDKKGNTDIGDGYYFENGGIVITAFYNKKGNVEDLEFEPLEYAHLSYKSKGFGKIVNKTIKIRNADSSFIEGTLFKILDDKKKTLIIFISDGFSSNSDASSEGNIKPYTDIALELSAEGYTTFRYGLFREKPDTNKTFDNYLVDENITIINYFKTDSIYKDYKIVLLSRGLGATALPRIVEKCGTTVSALIMLAPMRKNIELSNLEFIKNQMSYIKSLDPDFEFQITDSAINKELRNLQNRVDSLNSNTFNTNTAWKYLPMNLSANFWIFSKQYNPYNLLLKQNIKTLILYGDKDFVITKSDFSEWYSNCSQNANFTFKSYPKLNHDFVKDDLKKKHGKLTSETLHVENTVSQDIIEWLIK